MPPSPCKGALSVTKTVYAMPPHPVGVLCRFTKKLRNAMASYENPGKKFLSKCRQTINGTFLPINWRH